MNNTMIFSHPEFGKIRTLINENGEPLFCGKDVCDVLGYKKAYDAVKQHVNRHDTVKCGIWVVTGKKADGSPAYRKTQMLFVNESGFYALVLGSKLDGALRFKQWVTSEVLPSLRKRGAYVMVNEGDSEEDIRRRTLEGLKAALREHQERCKMQEAMIKEAEAKLKDNEAKLKNNEAKLKAHEATLKKYEDALIAKEVTIDINKKLIHEQDVRIRDLDKQVGDQVVIIRNRGDEILDLEKDIDRLLPKSLYCDNVLNSISCYTTTQVAKELGITAQELNRSLCACHVQYYQSGQYLLYADYAHMGLAKSRTRYGTVEDGNAEPGERTGKVITHTYLVWTERGRKFIHDLAKRMLHEASLMG